MMLFTNARYIHALTPNWHPGVSKTWALV